jgi:lactate racemase
LSLKLPDDCIVYQSNYTSNLKTASELLTNSLANPIASNSLGELLKKRNTGQVVVVVSDITRPIPYVQFLPSLLSAIEKSGVKKEEISILVATGMHRPSTRTEQLRMFGEYLVQNYGIFNHDCQNEDELQELAGRSWSGSKIKLNKRYVNAGFRIVTGLVEPHFMAGFSGGRKAICPGLVSLDAVQKFHGYKFLSHPGAASGILNDNPCHEENTSVAKLCPPDYTINIVLDNNKNINTIISGELFASHQKTVEYVREACCPVVTVPADIAVTSCGGYPLDATFYQCVKGFVNCLPALKDRGEIIAFGSCSEGIGSPEYQSTMKKYAGNYPGFIEQIKDDNFFIKDQWEFQMHIRALEKTGLNNLHFYTSNIPLNDLSMLSVNPQAVAADKIESLLQLQIDRAVDGKKRIAVFPEGPYCAPVIG